MKYQNEPNKMIFSNFHAKISKDYFCQFDNEKIRDLEKRPQNKLKKLK